MVLPLSNYLALDLTDQKGFLCGKILADLGVDVVKIERPGGDPARQIGPFYRDAPDEGHSLYWCTYNANKRGITLDLENPIGRDLFRRLAKISHFVLESYPPGHLDQLDIGYSSLSQLNPRLIVTSITPFGQTGPCSRYKATDLIVTAMSGGLHVAGDPDRPAVRVGHPRSYVHASLHGAVGTLIAHHFRQATGYGQHVDVSIQEAIASDLLVEPCYCESTTLERVALDESRPDPIYPHAFSETPPSARRRAPLVGEHNSEVYEHMLGLCDDEVKMLAGMGVT